MKNRVLLYFFTPLIALSMSGCFWFHDDDDPATLVIENRLDAVADIRYAYVTPSSWYTWGDELLGYNVLEPGDRLILNVHDCNRYYDIRVEYDGGPILEEHDLWLECDTTTYASFRDW